MPTHLDLSAIPVVDNHCHPWLRSAAAWDRDGYRLLFTEGVDPALAAGVASTIYYRWLIRELARVLGCAPTEDAVLRARAELGHRELTARLMAEARVEAVVVDHLFLGRGHDLFTVAEMGPQLGGAQAVAALRLESVLAALVAESASADEVEARYRARLQRPALAAERVVSLKSIVAYRTGLAIAPTSLDAAYAAFPELKAEATRSGSVRIANKPFLDYFLRIALAWCATEPFPIQFHTGFGDPDVDLRTGNPLHLRDVLQDERLRAAPIVLLHAGWPFVRETSYLASVYPNVHLDLGLAIPFAASASETLIREALSLAPAARVLWSSDGFAIPEHTWFAAVQGRRALGRELAELIDRGALDREGALAIARGVLGGNARRLYGLAATTGAGSA